MKKLKTKKEIILTIKGGSTQKVINVPKKVPLKHGDRVKIEKVDHKLNLWDILVEPSMEMLIDSKLNEYYTWANTLMPSVPGQIPWPRILYTILIEEEIRNTGRIKDSYLSHTCYPALWILYDIPEKFLAFNKHYVLSTLIKCLNYKHGVELNLERAKKGSITWLNYCKIKGRTFQKLIDDLEQKDRQQLKDKKA